MSAYVEVKMYSKSGDIRRLWVDVVTIEHGHKLMDRIKKLDTDFFDYEISQCDKCGGDIEKVVSRPI